jgi:RNA-directed DNA polymerase
VSLSDRRPTVPEGRLGPSDERMGLPSFRLCSVCCTAVPSRIRYVVSMPSTVSSPAVMWQAWCDVAANRGAPGVDGITIESIASRGAEGVRAFLGELADRIRSGRYRPAPLRRVYIPKPGRSGECRSLSIPTVADRVVMSAAKLVLEPIFEAGFLPVSFGFRPKRSAHDALEVVRVEANRGRDWVLDADVSDCFGSLDHEAVMDQVARRVSDRRMLS